MVLLNDSFTALPPAMQEGQRIINGMHDILKLFLTRIATVGLVVVSSLVVVGFPIELRNASALTIFTVGVPSALLAVWAQSGRRMQDSLGRTLAIFVIPAAVVSSLIGLLVFYGSIAASGAVGQPALDAASAQARTALTTFLVFIGLMLVVYVEPPIDWLAVAEPRSPDRRPTILAALLAVGFILTLLVPPMRDFFGFQVPGPREAAIVAVAVIAWIPIVRIFWKRQLIDRFLGVA